MFPGPFCRFGSLYQLCDGFSNGSCSSGNVQTATLTPLALNAWTGWSENVLFEANQPEVDACTGRSWWLRQTHRDNQSEPASWKPLPCIQYLWWELRTTHFDPLLCRWRQYTDCHKLLDDAEIGFLGFTVHFAGVVLTRTNLWTRPKEDF